LTELVKTEDGSHTLFVPELEEHYHSINGAVQESMTVFINNGFKFCDADPLYILEIGFGTGLNALLTAVESCKGSRKVYYSSLEKYPVAPEMINRLNYYAFSGEKGGGIFKMIHKAEWDREQEICKNFILKKIYGDLTCDFLTGRFDIIFFDAFGPDKQPEMWTSSIFKKLTSIMVQGGIFVTYSAKGDVKRNLRANGYKVTLLPGPPGKRHVIRAIKL